MLPVHLSLHLPPPPLLHYSHHRHLTISFSSFSSSSSCLRKSPSNPRKPNAIRATPSSNPSPSPVSSPTNPARDRVIDFGKHKGRMLGTLPSSYLRYVSTTLRAGDTEPWARLADAVLSDPVYRDRLEWEHAAALLSGDNLPSFSTPLSSPGGTAAALAALADRFGWDLHDRLAWSRVNLALLGTSFTARIPRKNLQSTAAATAGAAQKPRAYGKKQTKRTQDLPSQWHEYVHGQEAVSERREERRERRRAKREEEVRAAKLKMLGAGDASEKEKQQARRVNPFPGRGAVLDKIEQHGRRRGLI